MASSATETAAALDRTVDLDLLLDVLRGDLGLARDVAADEHDRAVLADGAGEGEPGAADDGRGQGRQDDAAEGRPAVGAERGGGLLDLAVGLDEHRLHRPHHERQGDEGQRDDQAPAGGVEVDVDRAVGAVEREQHDAGHDRRQGERQVDQRVDDALARELVADEHPGDQGAHHRVDDGDDGRDEHGDPQGGEGGGRGDGIPETGQALVEGGDRSEPRAAAAR